MRAEKGAARGLIISDTESKRLRLAILGGCSLYPLHELLTHLLAVEGVVCELFLGDYDNYVAHHAAHHPDAPVMSYEEFFRERQNARYGGGSGKVSRCC